MKIIKQNFAWWWGHSEAELNFVRRLGLSSDELDRLFVVKGYS